MKKAISIILIIILSISLCACETPQEKASRRALEATEAYEKQVQKVKDLERELEYVQWKIEQAEKNK